MNNSYNFSMRNPVLTANTSVNPYNQQPTTRLTLEQQAYQQPFQQMSVNQSNPYSDYLETFNSYSTLTQRKIQEDPRYTDIYSQCQSALLHEAFSQVMPTVLSTQSGRTLFEKLHITAKTLGEEFTQAELNREKEIAEREKATEEERKQLEAQKQELAQMLAQVKELQSALPSTISSVASQNGHIQTQNPNQSYNSPIQQNSTQAIVEPVMNTQPSHNNSNNQSNSNNPNNQQNKNQYQNQQSQKNKSHNGGNP